MRMRSRQIAFRRSELETGASQLPDHNAKIEDCNNGRERYLLWISEEDRTVRATALPARKPQGTRNSEQNTFKPSQARILMERNESRKLLGVWFCLSLVNKRGANLTGGNPRAALLEEAWRCPAFPLGEESAVAMEFLVHEGCIISRFLPWREPTTFHPLFNGIVIRATDRKLH